MNSPFVGPSPFTERNILFGRDAEIEELRWRIVADRILVLYSSSGAGKTSVLRAKNGLLRNMRDRFRVLPVLRVWDVRAESNVAEVNCITRTVLEQLQEVELGDIHAGDTLLEYFGRISAPVNKRRPTRMLMVIDQAEEIFAPAITESQQREFFRQLGELLSRESSPVWFVLSMREEYFSWLDPFRELVPTRLTNTFRLCPLSVAQAVRAIKGPTEAVGIQFPIEGKEDAAQKLARQLGETRVRGRDGHIEIREGGSVEPVQLQVICADLWTRLSNEGVVNKITVGDIDRHRPTQALEEYCDQTLDQAAHENPRARKLRDWIARKLLTPSGLRAQATIDDAENDKPSQEELRLLTSAHLVRELIRPNGEWYELSHDSLTIPVRASIEKWRLKNSEVWQRLARSWQLSGRSPTFLKSLSRESLDSIPRPTDTQDCSEDEVQFQGLVLAYRQQKLRERVFISIAASLLLVVASGWIYSQWSLIKAKANLLRIGNVMATQTALMNILGDNPSADMGTRAAVAGLDLQMKNANDVGFDFRPVLSDQLNKARQIEKMDVIGTGKSLKVWSNDHYRVSAEIGIDRWQLSVGEMKTGTTVWTADTKLVHPAGLSSVALMPDGRMATAGISGEIALWDIGKGTLLEKNITVDSTHRLLSLMQRTRIRTLVSLDKFLVAGNDNGVVAVWRASAQAQKARLVDAVRLHSNISDIAPFDGARRFAVSDLGEDERVNLLTLNDDVLAIDRKKNFVAEPKEGDFRGAFYSVAVSPDGQTIAAGNRAGRIHFWDIASGTHKGSIDAHLNNVVQLRYLNGNSLLSAGWDGQLKLWSQPRSGREPEDMTLLDIPRQLNSVAPGPSPDRLFVTTEKGDLFSVSLLAMRHPLGQFFPAPGTTVSQLLQQDGNVEVATASADGLVINSFDPSTERQPSANRHFSLPGVAAIAWAPDNGVLYTGQKTAIKLIRPGKPEPVDVQGLALTPIEEIKAMTTNADGSIIAAMTKTTSKPFRTNIRIWAISPIDGSAGKCAVDYPPEMVPAKTLHIAFRPKHAELATVVGDAVSLWTVTLNGEGCPVLSKEPKPLPGGARRGEIRAISFDKRGNQLFMANYAGVVSSVALDAAPPQAVSGLEGDSTMKARALVGGENKVSNANVVSTASADARPKQVATSLEDDSTINITALAGSETGVVAVGDYKGKLYILYPGKNNSVRFAQDVHSSAITSLSISSDGRWLASSDAKVTALWDLSLDSWASKACAFLNHSTFTQADHLKFFKSVEEDVNPCNKSPNPGTPTSSQQGGQYAN